MVGISDGIGFLFGNGELTQAGPPGFLPNAINDSGNMVGASGIDSKAALLSGGQETLLPNLDTRCCNGASSDAIAINNSNEIAGTSRAGTGSNHAVVWNNGIITDLGTLGGLSSGVSGINNLGQVVGTSQTSTGAFDGFLYTGGKMTDLGAGFLPAAINDNGQILAQGGVAGDDFDATFFLLTPSS